MRSKGLGDSIEKITKATGIKHATEWIFDKLGKDCGCDKRKEALNKMFPYKVECLNEDEYIYLKDYFSIHRNTVNVNDQLKLLSIHNRVFNTNKKKSSCGSCVKDLVNTMKKLYEEYEKENKSD